MCNSNEVFDSKAERIFHNSGIEYTQGKNGLFMFRDPDFAKCDYFATKGTWLICGEGIVEGRGKGPQCFLDWYKGSKHIGRDTTLACDSHPATEAKADNSDLDLINAILAQVLELKQRIEERE